MIHLSSVIINGEECALDVHYRLRPLTIREKLDNDIRSPEVVVIEKCELHPGKNLIYRLENEIDMELGGE